MHRTALLLLVVLVACAPRGSGRLPDAAVVDGAPVDGATAPDAAAIDGAITDADSCACHDVGGSTTAIACGASACIDGSNWTCSDGAVRGLAIRTGVCMDAGTPPDAGSTACSAACSACDTMSCDECNSLGAQAATDGCAGEHAEFASCLAGACTDITMCLTPFGTLAACECPTVSPRLHAAATTCGVSTFSLTCADMLNQAEMLACSDLYARMGCAAFGTTSCGGG